MATINLADLRQIADVFSPSVTYAVGDHCIQGGLLYECTTAHTGAWNASHFNQVKIGEELSSLKADLTLVKDVLDITEDISVTKTVNNETVNMINPINLSIGDVITVTLASAINKSLYFRIYDSTDTRVTNQSIAAGNTSFTYNVATAIPNARIEVYTLATGAVVTVTLAPSAPLPNVIDTINGNIGDLAELDTTDKTSLVDAINETLSTIPTKAEEVVFDVIDDNYFDYARNARYNADDAIIGKYVNPDNGNLADNATEFTTDYLPIRQGETLYCFRVGSMQAKKIDYYACYDKNKNHVANSGGSNVYSVSQSGDIAYVRMSIAYNATYYVSTPWGIFIVPTEKPWYCQQIDADPTVDEDYLPRKTIYVYATDTEEQVIEKFVNAYKRGNCDLQFERAHYNFGTVLPNVKTLYHLNENEIPIGNNCRYFFNGSTLTAEIDLNTLGLDFYCNLLGTQRFPSSFEMYDGILISTDTRYVVHDEASAYSATYRRLYKNMTMHYITDARTDSNRKCLGGGTGLNGVVDIEGCKFITEGTGLVQDASYHGIIDDTSTAEFSVTVTNSWFSKNFAVSDKGENQTARVMFTGNSTAAQLINLGWDATAFMNEVRT